MKTSTRATKAVIVTILFLVAALQAASYDPPAGALDSAILASPQALSLGRTITGLDGPWADRLNPSASAAQQRPVLEAGFTALTDFGLGSGAGQGFGGAASIGFSLPQPYGVWGGGLDLIALPASMTSLPLGTRFDARVSLAKDLFPNLFIGASLKAAFGSNGSLGWGAGMDLGMIQLLGDRGFLKDFRYGVVLSDLGKGFGYESPATGIFGGSASSFPPPFTLGGGARAYLVKSKDIKLGMGLDLALPTFQDLSFDLSATVGWRDMVGLRMGWGFDLRELLEGSGRSLIPAFGLTATIPLQRSSTGSGVNQAELKPYLSAAPLYGGVWALGLGVTMPLGVIDKKAPQIEASYPATSWGPYYMSPNNDGKKDSLEIPLSIKDERYVVGWTLTISDAGGKPVRRIFNKESRPETMGFKGLWERLVYIKKGVPVPERLVWNGVTDSGSVAPDGRYTVQIEAVDDNGNHGTAGPFDLVLDATSPKAELVVAETPPIFSPDGDGNKDNLLIAASGSVEDRWSLRITDAGGNAVRSLEYLEAGPANFIWDGKDDTGRMVPDGIYNVVLDATDRAGNSVVRRFDNIVVNTQQAPVSLMIDLATFSPNGDGIKDFENIFPSVPIKANIVGWKLSVLDREKREVWSVSGKDGTSLKDRYAFDGRGSDARVLPEGQYQATIAVTYLNGNRPQASSPVFALDVTPPRGSVSVDRAAFNPAGSEGQNMAVFENEGSKEDSWTAEVIDRTGAVVKSWRFVQQPDAAVEWDGSDDGGKPLPDGVYVYRIRSQDRAGNAFTSNSATVALDTEKKTARLTVDQRAFSPNGDGSKDSVRISPFVQANDKIKGYELSVVALDVPGVTAGTRVRTWSDSKGLPESFVWDGLDSSGARAKDGRYAARLAATYQNEDKTEAATAAFTLDTTAPSVQVSAAPLLFSPNADSRRKVVRFTQKSVAGDDWEGRIVASDETVVRSFTWKSVAVDFVWDGTDEAGNLVKDGIYRYEASSQDAAGNRGTGAVTGIRVDKRPAQVFVTVSDFGLSPNGDGIKDDITFSLIVNLREGVEAWRFALFDAAGKERAVFGGEGGTVPSRIVWDGRDLSGKAVDGEYYGVFSVSYLKGDVAEARSGKVVVDTEGPEVTVSITPELFSPDNDGVGDELTIAMDVKDKVDLAEWRFQILEIAVAESASSKPAQRVFMTWSGSGAPAKTIVWDGRSSKGELVESATDYPFVFTVRDVLGTLTRVEGFITVDVLVIRDGDRLKIKIPTIVFRPNFSDFVGLDTETVERNNKVIRRIAQILNRFRDYRIGIEGHANSEAKIRGLPADKIAAEEQNELLPLSLGRAELVRKLLAENGVDEKRMSVTGLGSSQPVVDFQDAENRWKNRRVEFILIKNVPTASGTGG